MKETIKYKIQNNYKILEILKNWPKERLEKILLTHK